MPKNNLELYFIATHCSAGKDLSDLYRSSAVQAYMNGMTAKELYPDKSLYQPGFLRKVKKAMFICRVIIKIG